MINLSNDRKAVLKSAATGISAIALLSLGIALVEQPILSLFFALLLLFAVYWFIPSWFNLNRQLIIKKIKSSTQEGLEIKQQRALYQYFNADGKEVTPCSFKEKMVWLAVSIIITFILIVYPPLSYIESKFPNHDSFIFALYAFISSSTSYILRHILYFYKDLPVDISDFSKNNSSAGYPTRSSSSSTHSTSLDHFTSGRYSYLPYNINNHRKY